MNKIKILAISTSGLARKEGISTVILDNFSRFDKNIFELHVIAAGAYNYELIQEFEKAGVSIKCLPSRKASIVLYVKAFISLFRQEKYNALYIHGSSAIMSIELLIAKMCGCKMRVVHSHNTTCDHKKSDKLLRPFFYRLYTDAIACGKEAGKWLYGGRPFLLLKNGRDVNRYRYDGETRSAIRKDLGVSGDELLVGHVGNFNKQKNQKFALEIFRELLKRNNKAKLYLMGAGILLDKTKNLAVEMGLQDKVIFTGSIGNVHEMLQAMDVMTLPSLHEGLPLVTIEWQIAALPSVISDVVTSECAYSDLVTFLPLDNATAWAEKIVEVAKLDRAVIAEKQVELTKAAGFDINQNARELQRFFRDRCKR
ncbi:glycosyltransferase family 1 protein [Enterocloster asparagiformis]|uniref:glycosyltransferase family 1 protein n=1 Tax=Enterocloster asparagiformis TaxID=333367 RepID=UPI0004B295C3|nr:glycosyltransferase family 1 protein [Enterocloster asparagiformis]